MALLNIEQSNIGYSTDGIQSFINALNLQVITELIATMQSQATMIGLVVDQVWVGQSATAFKNKLERDTDTMCETLKQVKEELVGQFAQIAQNVDNYDSAIADSIKSQTE